MKYKTKPSKRIKTAVRRRVQPLAPCSGVLPESETAQGERNSKGVGSTDWLDVLVKNIERTGREYAEAHVNAGQASDVFWYLGQALQEVARKFRAEKGEHI